MEKSLRIPAKINTCLTVMLSCYAYRTESVSNCFRIGLKSSSSFNIQELSACGLTAEPEVTECGREESFAGTGEGG